MKVYPIRNKEKLNKIELILKATNKRNYLLFVLGTNTGLRISDILKLTIQDVKGQFINITEQKTQKKNTIKINKKLKEAIKEFLNSLNGYNDDIVLFSSRIGVNRPISIRRAQQIIKDIAIKVGIAENINTHSLRKSFAYNVYKLSNNNIGLVMELLNHSKEIITLKYLCLIEEQKEDIIDLLGTI